jgi:hypothetical protein
VKESFTAAIVARSLLAAERSSWLVGVLEGWVVARRELVQHWCRWRSAYVLNWGRQICGCWCPAAGTQRGCRGGDGGGVRLTWGHPPAAPVSDEKPVAAPIRCPVGGLKLRSYGLIRHRPPVGDQGHWFGR